MLEPPGPPPEDVDMDALRAAANAPRPVEHLEVARPSSAIERFIASMVIDHDKWHDGIGYDLDALRQCSASERASIVSRLVPPKGWRDVEALATIRAIGSESADRALRAALTSSVSEVRLAVVREAPDLVDQDARTATLVRALEEAGSFNGLDAALTQVEQFHPPAVVAALFRGLFTRDGTSACHYAAMLAFVHGKTAEAFDWSMRPLFLKFNTNDAGEREAAFLELCTVLEVDPDTVSRGHHR